MIWREREPGCDRISRNKRGVKGVKGVERRSEDPTRLEYPSLLWPPFLLADNNESKRRGKEIMEDGSSPRVKIWW